MPAANKRRIVIIQGHPEPGARRLCHVLAQAYADGASEAGHEVRLINVSALSFPLLRSESEWNEGPVPEDLVVAQQDIAWAQHIVFFFPLWMGDMPALLKGFLEQVARPGFAFRKSGSNPFGQKALAGRSARVVVTMGMPAAIYRYVFRAHSVRSLERNVLGFVGIAPVNETLIGGVDQLGELGVAKWSAKMRELGAAGE